MSTVAVKTEIPLPDAGSGEGHAARPPDRPGIRAVCPELEAAAERVGKAIPWRSRNRCAAERLYFRPDRDPAGSRLRCDATRERTNGGAQFPRLVEARKSTQRSDEFVDFFQLGRNLGSDLAGPILQNPCQESLATPVS